MALAPAVSHRLTAGAALVGVVAFGVTMAVDAPVAVLVLGAAVLGLAVVNVASYARRSDRSLDSVPYALLVLGFVVCTSAVTQTLVAGAGDEPSPYSLSAASAVGASFAAAALLLMLRAAMRERALGVLFEGLLCLVTLAFFPWAAVTDRMPAQTALHYLPPLVTGVAIWIALRVWVVSRPHRRAIGLLAGGLAALLAVQVTTSEVVDLGTVAGSQLDVLALWACVLWGAAALHPAIQRLPEVVVSPPTQLGPGRVAAPVGLMLFAPALFTLQALNGNPPPLSVVLGGSSVLALLVAVYLVRQVHEAASAEYRAYHDPLTGLPHRVLFQDRLDAALTQARRNDGHVGVMFLDLDRFKTINDSLGHAVGNQLLQQVAQRLRHCVRETDTVARMGGDEFMVLLPTVGGYPDCVRVAEKLLDAFSQPFLMGARELTTSASIGIAMFPDNGESADTLVKSADIAMYRAKANGRDAYEIHTPDMSTRAEMKHSLESQLRVALDRGDLELHYQPKIDVLTGGLVGLEALARWPHPDLGYIPPKAFVALAEETGLIVPLGEWVLEDACRQVARWSTTSSLQIPVAINLSVHEFARQPIDARIADALARHRIPPTLLELEITETVFMHDLDAGTHALYNLRNLGVRCSIDDFGTGYSGLTYLSQLPIHGLKIDQSFIRQIGARVGVEHIIEAVITLGRSLHMTVIGEGVETMDQARFLADRRCDQMQGWLISPPLAAHAVDELFALEAVQVGAALALGRTSPDAPGLRPGVGGELADLQRDASLQVLDRCE